MDCPHFKAAVFQPTVVESVLLSHVGEVESTLSCHGCDQSTASRWICLACGEVNCGRFVKAHALAHYQESTHPVALDLDSRACHCYTCDEYIHAGALESALDDLRVRVAALVSPEDASSTLKQRGGRQKYKNMTGLGNLGNTCFMNVVLQTLCHTEILKQHYLQPLISPVSSSAPALPADTLAVGRTTRQSAAKQNDIFIWGEFCKIAEDMWQTSLHTLVPEALLQAIWKVVPAFRGYQQQDAQEFLRYLLDRMQTELSKRKGRTVVMQAFQGSLYNKVTCLECSKVSIKTDPFLDLSLPIPEKYLGKGGMCTLEDCLTAFTEVEQLTDAEAYHCDTCNQMRPATKRLCIQRLPHVLSFHLKRFRYNRQTRCKIDAFVKFPLVDLSMESFTSKPTESHSTCSNSKEYVYDLYSVIVHHGSSGAGHYICFVWNPSLAAWFEVNDGSVRQVGQDVVEEQQAYMLFYNRRWRQSGSSNSGSSNGGTSVGERSPSASMLTPPPAPPPAQHGRITRNSVKRGTAETVDPASQAMADSDAESKRMRSE
ncbi:hypothetical protein BC831DRAFT_470612 [Entophlyctis helioformis]|nr:hypothetical protein BC831DRAFT_470612 [Entophlyctis helioformis]